MSTKPQTKDEALSRIAAIERELPLLKSFVETAEEPKNIIERVKSFSDALKIYINQFGPVSQAKKSLLEYSADDKDMIAAQGFLQMSIIRSVLNEGWVPDWEDGNYKYYPWFKHSGSGLSYDVYANDYSTSSVGSRLCFKTRELAEYAGKQFIDVYSKFHVL